MKWWDSIYKPDRKVLIISIVAMLLLSYGAQYALKSMIVNEIHSHMTYDKDNTPRPQGFLTSVIFPDLKSIKPWLFNPADLWEPAVVFFIVFIGMGIVVIYYKSRLAAASRASAEFGKKIEELKIEVGNKDSSLSVLREDLYKKEAEVDSLKKAYSQYKGLYESENQKVQSIEGKLKNEFALKEQKYLEKIRETKLALAEEVLKRNQPDSLPEKAETDASDTNVF